MHIPNMMPAITRPACPFPPSRKVMAVKDAMMTPKDRNTGMRYVAAIGRARQMTVTAATKLAPIAIRVSSTGRNGLSLRTRDRARCL